MPGGSVDVAVVGAGLSGLATALLLHEAGRSVRVLEAHERPGGRIRSVRDASGGFVADLGPTWIWTPYQPVAARWLERLGLETFLQHDGGDDVYEPGGSEPPVRVRMPVQDGSHRLVGGSQALVDRLAAALPPGTVQTSAPVRALRAGAAGVCVQLAGAAGERALEARRVVLAVPLRVAAGLAWEPEPDPDLARVLAASPTWMAPQAKAVVRYAAPFWRERGLSGRVVSRAGPLVEAHDHCGPHGSPAALFGFVGWPAAERAARGAAALQEAIVAQLARCLGPGAPDPLAVHVQDWADVPGIATPADLAGPFEHPAVLPGVVRGAHLDGRLWLAVAETAERSPGLLEGALDAAERVARAVLAAG